MAEKIGRNDACPCGSGKKYKKCCATTALDGNVIDIAWRNIRQTEGHIVDKHLMSYVMNTLPATVIKTAIEDFLPEELPDEIEEEHFFNQFVIPWVLFSWIPGEDFGIAGFNAEQTIAVNYLNTYPNKLNTSEKRFIEAMAKTHYSFYSVLEIEFEKSLVVKDILLNTTHIIKERQGTHYLQRGDIVFSRILTVEEQSIFVGMAPVVFPARLQTTLLDFKDWLIEENNDKPLTQKALREELDIKLFDYFFEGVEFLYNNPKPTLVNTDGDLILFSKSYFKLNTSIEDALHCLLPLTLLKKPDRFLESAKRDKTGNIKSLDFPWLIKGNKKHKDWENTIMGHITIHENKLVLETNSEKRTQKCKKLLTKYLGEKILFQQTLIETPEQKLESLPQTKSSKETLPSPYDIPEVQEQLKLMAKKHWENWFDNPIPALNNKTPREAAKTKTGRERLEALLLHYESNDSQLDNEKHILKADINYLKKELKLK